MADYTLKITPGLPFKKEINIRLPAGRDWWTELDDFEIFIQIRKDRRRTAPLIMDLTSYLTITMVDANNVRVVISLTGEETRTFTASGYYDVLMSDPGTLDARAYILVKGYVKKLSIVTAEAEGLA